MRRNIILLVVMPILLVSQSIASLSDLVYLRLKWNPGEIFKYRFELQGTASAGSESVQVKFKSLITLEVLDLEEDFESFQSASELQRNLMLIELKYEEMKMSLKVAGQNIKIKINENDIEVFLNGDLLSPNQTTDICRDLKPVQDILKARIRLLISEFGRVVKVMGLENLDETTQKELSIDFLQGMCLPEKPMRIGDQFVEKRSLASIFPKQPGRTHNPLESQTVELVRTLSNIQKDSNGRLIATFTTPLKRKFIDVPIDSEGTEGTVDVDVLYTSIFDIEKGNFIKETAKGTLLIRPNRVDIPGVITVKINANLELVDAKSLKNVP